MNMMKSKVVSKRHLNRKIRKKFNDILNDLSYNSTMGKPKISSKDHNVENGSQLTKLADTASEIDHQIMVKKNNNPKHCGIGSLSVLSEIRASIEDDLSTNTFANTNTDEGVSSTNIVLMDTEPSISLKLRQWACMYNISHAALTNLLSILNDPRLPRHAKSLLKTTRSTSDYITLNNGSMFYFGIEKNLHKKIPAGLSNCDRTITVHVNIDGLPIFKNSSIEFWPILILSNDLIDNRPFAVAIFCGNGKPKTLDMFLEQFIKEAIYLQENGTIYQGIHYSFHIRLFTCDAPARAFLKCIIGHTSKYSCERCKCIGKWQNHRIHFANILESTERKGLQFREYDGDDQHIKGKSPLLKLGLDLVEQFTLDPMHLLHLGVVKRLLYMLTDGRNRLSQLKVNVIDRRIALLRRHVTSDFPRKPRGLSEVKRWKATEFRFFALYSCVTILHNIINKENYEHFLKLHCAMFILSNRKLINSYFNLAKNMLKEFVETSSSLYGETFVVYNVHGLLHLCSDVEKYGPLDLYSSYPFENYLGHLKQKIRSKRNPLQQIRKRIEEMDCLDHYFKPNNNTDVIPKNKCNEVYSSEQILLSFNCTQLKTPTCVLCIEQPNNCVLLKCGKICLINSIQYIENNYILTAVPFYSSGSLYTVPIDSTKLKIFRVRKSSVKDSLTFHLSDISCKYLLLPHKEDSYAAFPINHILN